MNSTRLFLFSTALALFAGCSRHAEKSSSSASTLPTVQVRAVTVRAENSPLVTEVTGTIRPLQRAQLAARVMGAIEEIPVTLGQRVRRGDILVKIAAGEISARLAQARSQLNSARRDLERERALLTKGASTTETVKNLDDRVVTTEAQVNEAEVLLGYAVVLAPFDGVVARKPANAGDLASPGVTLIELDGTTAFEVEAGVPEAAGASLAVGTPVAVEIPSAKLMFTGKVAEVSSAADALARTIAVKIAVPEGAAVRSGQFARIEIPGELRRTFRVPASAVTSFGQMERIFVIIENNRAALRLVKTGAVREGHVEILAGIAEGDRVIVTPPPGLRDGQPVEMQP